MADSSRELFHKHPWSIGGGGASELKEQLEERAAAKLESLASSIGFASFTGTDEAFLLEPQVLERMRVLKAMIRPTILGDNVRDWSVNPDLQALAPYDANFDAFHYAAEAPWARFLWHFRSTLGSVISFGGKTRLECGDQWWTWYRWVKEKYRTPLSIVFGEVATHNHFVLDRGGKVFKQTAPVIKLPRQTTEDDHLGLLGLLNSSAACFWLKQVCFPKGGDHVGQEGARVRRTAWDERYAFNGTNLQQFPLPLPDGRGSKANEREPRPSGSGVLGRARRIDKLAQQRQLSSPTSVLRVRVPSRDWLSAARAASDETLCQMMAAQEELDWECYRLYGLIADDLTYRPSISSRDRQGAVDSRETKQQEVRFLTGAALGIKLGQRAFEIVLARKIAAGETQTTWFERHGSTPITELPSEWPDDYRQLVERRIALIESDPNIRLIEQPEYKRRWNTEPWESQLERALREWLLNRLEGYFDFDGRMKAEPDTSSRARQEAVSDADTDATPTLLDDDWNGARLAVPKAEVEPQAYFVTFTCYGTWLHGDERGSVDRDHNEWQTPPLDPDEERERREFELLRHSPVKLESQQRLIVHRTIQEVCQNRGWRLHAVNVRTNHIHVVVTANRSGKRVLNDFKSYATRRMKEAESLPAACLEVLDPASSRARQEAEDSAPKFKVWTRGGSARPVLTENSFRRAIEYTLYEQGPEITPGISGETSAKATGEELRSSDHGKGATDLGNVPLPNERGSSPPLADITLVSVARLASVAGQDADFLQVGELYRDDAAFDVQALVTELVAPECVPLLPVLRYKPAGLIKRTTWERTWDLQRQEDAIDARTQLPATDPNYLTEDAAKALKEKQVGKIAVPTKYDSKDFLTSDFWRLRGKLDVPKERWISFPHCDGPDGTMMLCWAGYDHLQQARAISAYYVQVQTEFGGSDDPRLIPLLACLIELLPWLKQWHNDLDPEFNMSMGDYFEGFINEEARQLGKTPQEIREWTPPAKTAAARGRRKKS